MIDTGQVNDWKIQSGKHAAFILKFLFIYGLGMMLLVIAFVTSSPEMDHNDRAIILMGFVALWVCWIGICGIVMYKMRDRIKARMPSADGRWMLAFVLFATAMALLEEVFTVTATNLHGRILRPRKSRGGKAEMASLRINIDLTDFIPNPHDTWGVAVSNCNGACISFCFRLMRPIIQALVLFFQFSVPWLFVGSVTISGRRKGVGDINY